MKNAQLSPRERQRQAQDEILVFNPTNEDFIQPFDRVGFKIPAAQTDIGYGPGLASVPRYVAELYVKNMIDKVLGEKLLKAVDEENKRRVANGMKEMDKYMGGEQDNFERNYRIDNEEAREAIFPMLWKGVYKQFGFTDFALQQEEEAPRDTRTFEERMAEKYDIPAPQTPPMGSGTPAPEVPVEAITPAEPSSPTMEEQKNEAIADVAY